MSSPGHEELARDALAFDPIETANKITGDPDIQETAGLAWLLMAANHDIRKTHLSELCDTYYRMPWAEFKEVIQRSGFLEISSPPSEGFNVTEEKIIVAHPERKLLGVAKSTTWDETTGPILDYNFIIYAAYDGKNDPNLYDALYRTDGSMHPVGDTYWELTYYATEGLNLMLKRFDELGLEFCDWPKCINKDTWMPEIPHDAPGWVKDFTGAAKT